MLYKFLLKQESENSITRKIKIKNVGDKGTHQKGVGAVAAGDAAHAGHGGYRRCHGTGCQIDNSLAVGARTGNPLG